MYILEKINKKPLHIQLYEQIKKDIQKNYKVGEKLPSIRKMSSFYNLSKTTVESAYTQLVAEGYIESYPNSGYRVEDTNLLKFENKKSIDEVEEKEDIDWLYDFCPARLSQDSFPLKLWKRLFTKHINESLDFGTYSSGQGEYGLREEISKYIKSSRGVNCHANQIVIGSGLLDSLGLLARILDKKDNNILAIENPGYCVAKNIFESYGYDIDKIGLDKNGLKIDELENSKAKLVYVTPSHQYPTGTVIPISNRHKLIDWAVKNDALIIEDDYDSELNYLTRPIPSLQALDNFDRVIYVGTFSKSLSAALRVSYMVLPNHLMPLYQKNFSSFFSSVSLMIQKTLEKFISEGHWDKHLRKIRTLNRKKHDLLKSSLIEKLGETMQIEAQGAGLSIHINARVDIDLEKLKNLAREERVKIYFRKDVSKDDWDAIRMGFGGFQIEEIPKAVDLFAKIWHKSLT
jgi:GntR family transcriptional regulator/MocR family aminotransferase